MQVQALTAEQMAQMAAQVQQMMPEQMVAYQQAQAQAFHFQVGAHRHPWRKCHLPGQRSSGEACSYVVQLCGPRQAVCGVQVHAFCSRPVCREAGGGRGQAAGMARLCGVAGRVAGCAQARRAGLGRRTGMHCSSAALQHKLLHLRACSSTAPAQAPPAHLPPSPPLSSCFRWPTRQRPLWRLAPRQRACPPTVPAPPRTP